MANGIYNTGGFGYGNPLLPLDNRGSTGGPNAFVEWFQNFGQNFKNNAAKQVAQFNNPNAYTQATLGMDLHEFAPSVAPQPSFDYVNAMDQFSVGANQVPQPSTTIAPVTPNTPAINSGPSFADTQIPTFQSSLNDGLSLNGGTGLEDRFSQVNNVASGTGDGPGLFSQDRMFGAEGQGGWFNPLMQGVGTLANIGFGSAMIRNANQQLDLQRDAFDKNYNMQLEAYNRATKARSDTAFKG